MADSNNTEAIATDQVQINVVKTKGLAGSKGYQITAVAKVDFGTRSLGESAKLEVNPDTGYIHFDFTSTLNVSAKDPAMLDELAQTPIVVTFSEILAKDKKAKEEKSVVLGQCCIDLLPLLRGDISFSIIDRIHPAGGILAEVGDESTSAEVEIVISTQKPLLSAEQLETCNLMTVCIESAFSLPESWNPVGNQYLYAACMPIPVTDEKESLVLVPNGMYRGPGEKELSGQRKWSCVPSASGSCLYIPNTTIHQTSYEDEDGDLRNAEDIQFRVEAENEKPHITWNSERRCFMSTQTTECFQQKISSWRYWPLEIIRTALPSASKGKGKEEEAATSFHGIAYVDLAPLLYPGVSKIRGAYQIHPYIESEVQDKLNRKGAMNEGVIRTIIGSIRSSSSIGNQKGSTKQGKSDTKTKSVTNVKVDGSIDVDSMDYYNQEGVQYRDARTYVILEIELEKPIVQRRRPETVAARLASLIPPRDPYPKKNGGSKKAVEDFENQIANMSNLLLEEFRTMFGGNLTQNADDAEDRRRAFLYELNTSGKYFALKEQMKYFVVKIVREKYMYTKDFENHDALQEFISVLYRGLLDHMNVGLNKFLSTEETADTPKPVTDNATLYQFAKEAEVMFRYDVAATYYQERIARSKSDCQCWLDYGVFCLLIQDIQKAEECFKEVVSLNQTHLIGILMNGISCLLHEEYDVAGEFFEVATYTHPNELLAWTLHGLYYSGIENTILSERSFSEAKKLLNQLNIKSKSSDAELVSEMENLQLENKPLTEDVKYKSIFLITTKFLLERRALQMAERALSHELVSKQQGPKVLYLQLLAQLQIEKKLYSEALQNLEEALTLKHDSPDCWSLKGHIYYILQEYSQAKDCYERCLAYAVDAENIDAVYLRLASIYYDVQKEYDHSKRTYLKLCTRSPSCITWLGVGKSCYRLHQLVEAEQALNEANILENKNPHVWAYLALLCLKKERHLEAEQCYKYAYKLGVSTDEILLNEMKDTMISCNFDMSVL